MEPADNLCQWCCAQAVVLRCPHKSHTSICRHLLVSLLDFGKHISRSLLPSSQEIKVEAAYLWVCPAWSRCSRRAHTLGNGIWASEGSPVHPALLQDPEPVVQTSFALAG